MPYTILWDPRTEGDLRHIGRPAAERIRIAVTTKLAENPRMGKQLKGKFKIPLWSFRVGTYRVIYTFSNEKVIIVKLRLGHRKDIYDHL